MKKKILLTIMAFIGIIAIYNIKVEATFLINDFEINCNVEENGNIYIEENITYYTNENKNGLIRTINTKNAANSINSADAFILEEVMVDGASYKKTNNAYVGNKGVYTQKTSGNSNEIKVFSPFNSNTKIVTYKYILTNVAVRYNDIAELYWNFIGDEWDCEINNLEINIILPEMAKNDTVYVYGHGSDNGTFSKTGNYITLRANNLEAYQALDARILFSADALSDSTKVINRDVLSKYRNEEEGMSKKRDEAKVLFGLSINQLALGISAVILIFGIIIYVKYDKEYKVEKYKYYREIPYNLEPEILQRIYYGKDTKDAFWITFLNLIKKGIFKIEKTTNEVGKETEKIIFNKEPEKLKQYQRTVMDIIKGFMKNEEKSIDMLDLQAKMKISTAIKYSKFQRELNSEIEGLFGETKKAPKKIISALTIAMIALIAIIVVLTFIMSPESGMGFGLAMFLGMTALVYSIFFATVGNSWFTVIFLIFHCGAFQAANIGMLVSCGLGMMYIPYVLLFILIQYVVRVRKKSKEERQILEQIKGLKRYIKEYSMLSEREEITQIELWEDYFILAIALGLNNSVIDSWYEYGQVFMNSNLETSLFNVGGYSHMAMTMRPVFNTYTIISTVTSSSSGRSSYSGSRGGFSGGSSSGGRGRRRRWRKFFLKI